MCASSDDVRDVAQEARGCWNRTPHPLGGCEGNHQERILMNVAILPSAIVDIVRVRCFYENLEFGLGARFQNQGNLVTGPARPL